MSDGMNIYQRMSKASGMCGKLAKANTNEFGKYKFVSHDQYVAMIRPILIECGVYVSFTTCFTAENKAYALSAMFINADDPSDSVTTTVPICIQRNDPQAHMAGLSYSKKYALSLALMVETGEGDSDDNDEHKRNTKAADDAAKLKAQCKNLCTALQLDKDAVNALWAECGKDYNVYLDALNEMADKVTDEEANTMKEAGQ